MKRSYLIFGGYLLILVTLVGCTSNITSNKQVIEKENNSNKQVIEKENNSNKQVIEKEIKSKAKKSSILYSNAKYGFSFSLPDSWKGYSVIKGTWEGLSLEVNTQGTTVATGSQILIRHPKWTSQNPRQDIPIMVFTITQWSSLQQGKFHIGAAPIGPTEIGHNKSYVFALPARYNYAFPTGYKEVENILKGKPLKASLNK